MVMAPPLLKDGACYPASAAGCEGDYTQKNAPTKNLLSVLDNKKCTASFVLQEMHEAHEPYLTCFYSSND